MRKFKGYIITILVTAFLSTAGSAYAEDGLQKVLDAYFRNDLKITLNGTQLHLNNAPIIAGGGTTYLPLRELASILGTNVDWDGATSTVILSTYGTVTGGTYGAGGTTVTGGAYGVTPTPTPVQSPTSPPPTTTGSPPVMSTDMIFYNTMDVDNKYPPMGKRYDDNGHLLWIINGVEFNQQEILTDSDKFLGGTMNKLYFSKRYYLHYLTEQQLLQFQKYKIDFNNKTVTPIN